MNLATHSNNCEHYETPREPQTSVEYLAWCKATQAERGEQYNVDGSPERSFEAIAEAFNAITRRNLKGSDICLIQDLLKKVRQYSNPDRLHRDSVQDSVNYCSLWAEEITKELNK